VSDIDAVAAVLGDRARRNVPLGPLTTYRVGGAAALCLEVHDTADLAVAAEAVQAATVPVLVIGKGSNLLVADRGFRGLALVLGDAFAAVEVDGTTVRAGAAVALPVLARRTAAAGLAGFEWAVGVPGSLGGAVRMNAGGHGSDMSRCVRSADVFDLCEGRRRTLGLDELGYGYRHSSIEPTQVVLGAELGLAAGDAEASEAQIAEIVRWRREHQPGGQNAGSVFTNPPGESAGRLVEACGLKGFRVGSAHVSPKHANFIQADEGGSADDVLALVVEVQRRVEEQTGVRLEPELRLIGFEGRGA
jgi:UDP-N-acetylmuramate dehydrogenase